MIGQTLKGKSGDGFKKILHPRATRQCEEKARGIARFEEAKDDRHEILKELKAQLVKLASDKGYEAADIKSVLDGVGIKIGLKPIKEIIFSKKLAKKRNEKMGKY